VHRPRWRAEIPLALTGQSGAMANWKTVPAAELVSGDVVKLSLGGSSRRT